MNTLTVPREHRSCDICHGESFDVLLERTEFVRNRVGVHEWRVRIVVCRHCGFVFTSPSPAISALADWYANSYVGFSGQGLDYSVDCRISNLKDHVKPNSTVFLELGSNDSPEFQRRLRDVFTTVLTVEPNRECTANYQSLEQVPTSSCDAIGAYFVLEHVPQPVQTLAQCRRALKEDGILVVEVPNVWGYGSNAAGLELAEHVSHFSPVTLYQAAASVGLVGVALTQSRCSRPYGFTGIFKRVEDCGCAHVDHSPSEVLLATTAVREGAVRIDRLAKLLHQARQSILDAARRGGVVIWGANANGMKLLHGFDLPRGVTLVDSDPCKKDFLSPHVVHQPASVLSAIEDAVLIVINTRLHADDIKQWIAVNCGRKLSDGEAIVVDLC